ncbi:NACHT domain-containing protein [Streptomyces sp. NPDC000345]|uniref:NACHT domain-containing protein n=1 Tax=Streptomyces sp. NPDC000345 TaxID=3364537 RepID=UPI0036800DCE
MRRDWSWRKGWHQTVENTTIAGDLVQIQVAEPPSAKMDYAQQLLAESTRSRLQAEIARRRLEQPEPIHVRWSSTARSVQPPSEVLATEVLKLNGNITEITALLRRLPRRQLLVLGEPGSGKSVLALLLARDLLRSREPCEPIPVLLALSSWRPTVGLSSWMARQITELAPGVARFGRDVAAQMISTGRVIPVLDGLDELPEALHARAIEAIDEAVSDGVPLVATCRSDEYERVVARTGWYLTRAAVVEIESVKGDVAIDFLRRSRVESDLGRWAKVFECLRTAPDSALSQALSTPLMLALTRTAYAPHTMDPGELLNKNRFSGRTSIEDHLLGQFLPAVYREDPSTRYDASHAKRWLTTIARQMHANRTFAFEWWQINSYASSLLSAIVYGCVWGWLFNAIFGPQLGVACAAFMALMGFFVHTAVRKKLRQVYVTEVPHRPRETLRRYAALSVFSSLVLFSIAAVAVMCALVSSLEAGPRSAWHYGSIVGVGIGLATLLGSAWGSYQVSGAWYKLTGRLPWRLMRFLDDAHRLGVLRETGAVHQFRHARLQTYLSSTAPDPRWAKKSSLPKISFSTDRISGWHKRFLPTIPSLAQFTGAALGLVLVLMVTLLNNINTFSYTSGTKPHIVEDSPPMQCGNSPCGPQLPDWTWTLPPGSSQQTILQPHTHGVTVIAVAGSMFITKCPKSSVEVSIAIGNLKIAPFTVDHSSLNSTLASQATLSRRVDYENAPVSVTLLRRDSEHCTAEVHWVNPGLTFLAADVGKKFSR